MNKQLVIVKDFEMKPLLRKVCYANETTVFVTSEKAFEQIKNGDSSLFPIGFSAENVFFYEGRPLAGKINWKQMKRWRANEISN
jgi:hypothetical protein